MKHGLDEARDLFRASVRKTPSLMMETVSVDSNRGVTSRGNSPYDKFASPATRAKVLEARLQEIEAFARNRSIPTSNVYAAAEAAMRTGKIPDLGQFGLAGDDAVALKQFLISDILNIAGLEWTDYKGDPVEEEVTPEQRAAEEQRQAAQKKLSSRRTSRKTVGGYELSDMAVDPTSYMAEDVEPLGFQETAGAKRIKAVTDLALQIMGEEGLPEPTELVTRAQSITEAAEQIMAEGAKGKYQHGFTERQRRKFAGADRGSRSNEMPVKKQVDARRERANQVTRDRKPLVVDGLDVDASRYMAEVSSEQVIADAARLKAANDAKYAAAAAANAPKIAAQKKLAGQQRSADRLNRSGDGLGARKGAPGAVNRSPARPNPPRQTQRPLNRSVGIDPSLYMAEGSGGRANLRRKHEAAKKAHDKKFSRLSKAAPPSKDGWGSTYDDLVAKTADTRETENAAFKRVKQRREARPISGHESARWTADRKEAYKKAGFPRAGGISPQGPRERPPGHPEGNQGWPGNRAAKRVKSGIKKLKALGSVESSVTFDPASYMAEEGPVGGPESTSLSPTRMSNAGDGIANPMSYSRYDLLPKAVMQKLKKVVGDGVYGYAREDLFRLAREHGLLGTEESVQESLGEDAETDLRASREANKLARDAARKKREGKISHEAEQIARARSEGRHAVARGTEGKAQLFKHRREGQQSSADIGRGALTGAQSGKQQKVARGEMAGTDWRRQFGVTVALGQEADKALSGKKSVVNVNRNREQSRQGGQVRKKLAAGLMADSPLVESHLGAAGNDRSAGSAGLGNAPGPTTVPYVEDEKDKKRKKQTEEERLLGILPGDPRGESWPKLGDELRALIGEGVNSLNWAHRNASDEQEKVKEDTRSDTDKILGIVEGDPRGESWPKLGDEMARLLNLENCGVFRGPRGFDMPDTPDQIEEMTVSGGMGGFIGAGMLGGGMTGRTCAMPSYDDSYELPDDPKKRIALLKKMLDKHGLKEPKEAKSVKEETTPSMGVKSPVMRDGAYNSHPSRFMKK